MSSAKYPIKLPVVFPSAEEEGKKALGGEHWHFSNPYKTWTSRVVLGVGKAQDNWYGKQYDRA